MKTIEQAITGLLGDVGPSLNRVAPLMPTRTGGLREALYIAQSLANSNPFHTAQCTYCSVPDLGYGNHLDECLWKRAALLIERRKLTTA